MDTLKDLAPLISDGGRVALYIAAMWFAFRIVKAAYADATDRYKETAGESKLKVEEIKKENEEIRAENRRLEEKIDSMGGQLARCRAESFIHEARIKTLEERLGILTPPVTGVVPPSEPGPGAAPPAL